MDVISLGLSQIKVFSIANVLNAPVFLKQILPTLFVLISFWWYRLLLEFNYYQSYLILDTAT